MDRENSSQMVMSQKRFDLDFIRAVAIVAVIMIHCMAPVVTHAPISGLGWNIANFIDSFMRWAVPVFVMISGALIIKKTAHTNTALFYKKRIRRLLIPLLIWPVIYFLWYIEITGNSRDIVDFFMAYISGKPIGGFHLYFLFLIAGLYIISPILSSFIASVNRKVAWSISIGILLATTLWLHIQQLLDNEISFNIISLCLPYIGYFLIGYLIASSKIQIKILIPILGVIASGLFVTIVSYYTMKTSQSLPLYQYVSAPVVCMSVSIFLLLQKVSDFTLKNYKGLEKPIRSLSISSFGIYLIHIIILQGMLLALQMDRGSVKTALLLVPITLFGSWSIAHIMMNIPKLKRVFG